MGLLFKSGLLNAVEAEALSISEVAALRRGVALADQLAGALYRGALFNCGTQAELRRNAVREQIHLIKGMHAFFQAESYSSDSHDLHHSPDLSCSFDQGEVPSPQENIFSYIDARGTQRHLDLSKLSVEDLPPSSSFTDYSPLFLLAGRLEKMLAEIRRHRLLVGFSEQSSHTRIRSRHISSVLMRVLGQGGVGNAAGSGGIAYSRYYPNRNEVEAYAYKYGKESSMDALHAPSWMEKSNFKNSRHTSLSKPSKSSKSTTSLWNKSSPILQNTTLRRAILYETSNAHKSKFKFGTERKALNSDKVLNARKTHVGQAKKTFYNTSTDDKNLRRMIELLTELNLIQLLPTIIILFRGYMTNPWGRVTSPLPTV